MEVGARLKDAPEMIAAGQFASAAPGVPEFPDGADIRREIQRTKIHVKILPSFPKFRVQKLKNWQKFYKCQIIYRAL